MPFGVAGMSQNSQFDCQPCNEIVKFAVNFGNFENTLECMCITMCIVTLTLPTCSLLLWTLKVSILTFQQTG